MKQRKCKVVISSIIYWTVVIGVLAGALVLGAISGSCEFITATVFCILALLCSIAYYVVLWLDGPESKKPSKDYISKNIYIRPEE